MKESSCLNQERNMYRSRTIYKQNQSKIFLNKYFGGFQCASITVDGLLDRRKCYYRSWTCICIYIYVDSLKFKMLQDINWWTGVVWITCDVLISCLDSHSDGTHSLQRIHCWARDEIQNFPNLLLWRNKLIYILNGLKVSIFSANFSFWAELYSFKGVICCFLKDHYFVYLV